MTESTAAPPPREDEAEAPRKAESEAPRDGHAGRPQSRGGHRRRQGSRGALAAPLLVWAVTRAVLLLCTFKVLTVPGPDYTSDIHVIYRGWSEVLRSGLFPESDVTWQYPPAAALAVLSPALLPFLDYAAAFYLLACAADAAVLGLLLGASRRPGRRRAGVWSWVAGVALLGPTAYARYDLMVTAVAVGALLAGVSRPRTAGALAAFGATLKIWPALLLLGAPRGRPTRTMWTAALIAGVAVMGFFAATMPGALAFVGFQQSRGTEVESLGALVFHVARQFGWEGQVLLNYGSMEFVGPYVNLVSDAALVLTVLAFAWLLLWRLRARTWTPSTPADAALTAVLLFTTTSRVLSPQYMIWLVGLAAVCLTLRTTCQTLPALLVLGATAMTLLEFPPGFAHVVASDWLGLLLLTVRNGLLVAASLLACVRLWRSTRAEADPDPDVTTAPSVRTSATSP
ncbi:glycosyltransferase family 87 protein [Streptomyces winkii]|uniref:glycosyltransferase family 87 protein n=1 Tax=Streptomyces winkii TaxID=3051178 RepID=UPI0028D135CB|nr:glycosyltransferase family 87 protein [Streptomyces sp. DSM 40971]